ncbi:MAG: hypothetical protein ACREPK_12455 [Rhodanobacteraceae bacterium]
MSTLSRNLSGATAAVLLGMAMAAMAQPAQRQISPPSQQPAAGNPQSTAHSTQFEQGTESSVTFPMQSGDGTVTVHAGMPAEVRQYGTPPAFATLDTNHDGRLSETEAQAYPPLDSGFLYASGGGTSISRTQYANWIKNAH